jgi:hypothetical protein
MTKKKYTKPACYSVRMNMLSLLAEASVELKTTSGLASDSYEILSKENSWYEDDGDSFE